MTLRAHRRRQRKAEPLAYTAAVRSVFRKPHPAPTELTTRKDKELGRLLRAARHPQRYPATDTRRGRPGKWKRDDLLRLAARLGDIPGRETPSHISFASFVDHHLRLPYSADEVIEALETVCINLFEAEQLARVTAGRLGATDDIA